MRIKTDLLTPNEWSRPTKLLKCVMGVVMHWTGNPSATAQNNRDYFEHRKDGRNGYGSAHYIIDQDGSVIQCIPESEVAYHCGSSKPDPESHRIYTNEARARFGAYATDEGLSPNLCTIGVELCPYNNKGFFTGATIDAAIELVAEICKHHGLDDSHITTHHNIVGWKDCPRLWTNRPELYEAFKLSVRDYLERGK